VTIKQIAPSGGALSRRLMFGDKLITDTDVLRQTDSQAAGAQPPSSPPFLSPSI